MINRQQRPSVMNVLVRLFLAVCALLGAGLFLGELTISWQQVAAALFRGSLSSTDVQSDWVVLTLRLPRLLLAILVGAGLAMSGAILQGLTRNDLADPGIIGINQGAAMVAVIALVSFDALTSWELASFAFLGGSLTAISIYWLAWRGGSSPARLVLVGIGMAAMAYAVTSLMIATGDIKRVEQAYFWLSGSLYAAEWVHVQAMFLCLIVLIPMLYGVIGSLNALMLEDDNARSIGLPVEAARCFCLLFSVLLASVAVSLAGGLGFIGLLAPHLARQWVGCDYARLLPVSALIGALLLLLADMAGRAVYPPYELPAGIVVAMIGAPYFAFVLLQNRRGA